MVLTRSMVRNARKLLDTAKGRAMKLAGTAAAAAVAQNMKRKGAPTATKTKKKRKTMTKTVNPSSRVSARSSKTAVIKSRRPKGVSKGFIKKVEQVINHDGAYGEYIYFGVKQLRQDDTDYWNHEKFDEQNQLIVLDDYISVYDAASVLFNQKEINQNFTIQTGNFVPSIDINLISSGIHFFFRSTSNHSVNIEMYECTYKDPTDNDAMDLAANSMGDYTLQQKNIGVATAIATADTVGIESRHYTSLHAKCIVKVHRFKLEPGEYTTLYVAGKSNRSYEGMKNLKANDTYYQFTKGSKHFWFSIFNDVTVAGTLTNRIHAFPSSATGGVAMKDKRVYKIGAVKAGGVTTHEDKNVVRIQQGMHARTTETDQQVINQGANNFSGAVGAVV